jgi:tRNA A-37 threonylcarbamoyl transferase component Bud32
MFDILYLYVINYNKNTTYSNEYLEMNDICNYNDKNPQYYELVYNINIFLQCCIKGTDIKNITNGIVNNIFNTLTRFNLHDTIDIKFSDKMKAYSYGSSAHIYHLENSNVIVKVYNKKLRWITDNHSIPKEIFNKELNFLQKQKNIKLLDYDIENMVLKMEYEGESLYDNFALPENWKEQIRIIFDEFNKYNIYYTEFRLQNILVKNNIIKIVDFGLAKNIDNCNNDNNCNVFIELLDLLNNRFKTVTNNETKNLLYITLMHNIKIHNMKKYSDNVY